MDRAGLKNKQISYISPNFGGSGSGSEGWIKEFTSHLVVGPHVLFAVRRVEQWGDLASNLNANTHQGKKKNTSITAGNDANLSVLSLPPSVECSGKFCGL